MYTGLAHSCYAPLSSHTDGSFPTYGTGKMLDYDVAADLSYNTRDAYFSASNAVKETDKGTTSESITFEVGDILLADRVGIFGDIKDTGTSSDPDEYRSVDEPGPYIGFGYMVNGVRDGTPYYEAYWFYKVQFAKSELNAKTKDRDSIEWGTTKMTGEAMGLRVATDMKVSFHAYAQFASEAAAVAWLKDKANITT